MKINKLTNIYIPDRLQRLHNAPAALYSSLNNTQLESLLKRPCVAIVGSRKLSNYGKQVTVDIASALAARGIVIISGLALGVDAVAHRSALDANGLTIAVLPGSIESIYPVSHTGLARQIIAASGGILSEYAAGTMALRWNFIARNRLIAGLADVLVITEAAQQSGSLHTAGFALEQGKQVLAVPGNITSETSKGTNNLIKAGATPITSYQDVLQALGIEDWPVAKHISSQSPHEQRILELLQQGIKDGEVLQKRSQLIITEFNQSITMLELTGRIRSLGGNQWAIA